ncbi:Nif3-like dinuclear metal center hexameric protein [Parasegetibacter sp. NRK P23]|uniref:Nif3-like dinuclear metal center hexameric protein n=1 Tax=Parasegetibacter sp. NRK P23 TaxID=2942999 RepID=UPI0020439ED3|nr:Nif3-like dinuclear metal center hexameric protein [Parasegetibacter sp. NRK P23]MCM5529037.1 Nif3-like dinuclear metal center hexameric protein [Parasegetibacter sp. NRK P23]
MATRIKDISDWLEIIAPPALQEEWDNSGLLTGNGETICTGVLVTLDVTEAVLDEAIARGCNMVVAHHPVIFKGLKKLTGRNHVERTVIKAIRNDIALYAIHTNIDNRINGVSGRMADKMGLEKQKVLQPMNGLLRKLYTYVPASHLEQVRVALFNAGAGTIGLYDECSFQAPGEGTFRAMDGANPFLGEKGARHLEQEHKLEVLFESWKEGAVLKALRAAHPYEEVAYEVVRLENQHPENGAGIVGELTQPVAEQEFLARIKKSFGLTALRHTPLRNREVRRVAVCGGAGSFLISNALRQGVDFYITADVKYHEFFGAEGQMVIADIGHFESEQFTVELLYEILLKKFPNFAVLKSDVITNPIQYYI